MAKDKTQDRFSLAQVPTQTTTVIEDTSEKDEERRYLSIEQALVKIMNDIETLKEGMLG